MELKKISILLPMLATSGIYNASAQIQGNVVGTTGQPLAGVICVATQIGSKTATFQSVTDKDGEFYIKPKNLGYYSLTVSMMGFEALILDSIKYDGSINLLKVISLQQKNNRLQEIELNYEKPGSRQELDKLTIDVARSITATGGNVLDVLSRAPGVVVDQQNSAIKLRGKEGVLILINNRPTYLPQAELLQMLKGINNGLVSKVEVITNPSAEMDATGAGGVINITLKDGKGLGRNLSFGINTGYGRRGKLGGDFNFSDNYGRLGLTLSYSSNLNESKEDWRVYRTNYSNGELFTQKTITNRESDFWANTGTAAITYKVNDRLTLSANTQLFLKKWNMLALNSAVTSTNLNINQRDDEKDRWTNLLSGINANYSIDSKSNFQFGFDYLRYQNKNEHNYKTVYHPQDSVENIKIDKRTPINIKVFKVDYQNDLSDDLKIKFGIKGALSNFNNKVVDIDLQDKTKSSLVDLNGEDMLTENIYAAYSNLNYKITANLRLNAGLRYEYTSSLLLNSDNVQQYDRKYGNLFPNLSIESGIANGTAQLGYQRRIFRPSFVDLAPFVVFLDPYTYVTGNSNLRPTITDNYSLQYKWLNYLFSWEYSINKNAINSFQPVLNEKLNTLLLTPLNINNVKIYSFSISAPFKIYSWWDMTLGGNYFHHKADIANDLTGTLKVAQNSYRVNLLSTFKLPKDYTVELSGYCQNAFIVGITKREIPAELNIGASKKINDRCSVNVVANDVLKTNIWKEKNNLSNPFLELNRRNNFETRIVRVSFAYKLGSSKLKGREKLDEEQRVN